MWKKVIFSMLVFISLVSFSSAVNANPLSNNSTTGTVEIKKTEKQIEETLKTEKIQKDEKDKATKVEKIDKIEKTEKKIDKTKFYITKPENRSYSTESKIAFIHGGAPSGTSVTIEVYGTMDLTRKEFDLLNLPAEDDYIEVFTETIKSGNMGLFDKQLDLVTGINRVVINYGVEGIESDIIIIYVIESIPLTLPTILPQPMLLR